jgi:hypothetical protein
LHLIKPVTAVVSPRTGFGEVSVEVEYTLARLLEREIKRLRHIERVRTSLFSLPKFTVRTLFTYLDVYELGYLSENQLWVYFSAAKVQISHKEVRNIVMLLDSDGDGKVSEDDLVAHFSAPYVSPPTPSTRPSPDRLTITSDEDLVTPKLMSPEAP